MGADQRQNALGDYLRARRALVTPAHVGLPDGPNRRVTGLRREEVAVLAGISADYYLRLERGRDVNPSQQVLDALARVLQLDDVERDYLTGLVAPRRRRTRRRTRQTVPDRLHHLLAGLPFPAFVEGRTFNVLASNRLAVALSPRLQPGYNRLRSLLLDPEEQAFHQDWATSAQGVVAALRRSAAEDIDDDQLVELVGELALTSERFRTLWARHDVRDLEGGTAIVNHPVVGELRLHREKLPVGGVLLVIYYPDMGSDSDEKLRLLAALATTKTAPGASLGGQCADRAVVTES